LSSQLLQLISGRQQWVESSRTSRSVYVRR